MSINGLIICGHKVIYGRILWTGSSRGFGSTLSRPQTGRFRDDQNHQGRPSVSHILGYARVSTDDQDLASQKTRLESAGAFRVFADVISGKTFDRPGLTDLLDHIRPGDTIAVVRLDRLGRSLRELLEVVDRKSTRLNSSHSIASRMPSSA